MMENSDHGTTYTYTASIVRGQRTTAVNWRLSSGGSRQFSPKKFPENSETCFR